ncbi:MAG: radical SAM protein [Acidobacteriota bacterium]|nr:radical SAM protein [Blastocatellia bacterium]MDW8238409.1 radical SAM protein [Acidobacteriota bacterium]
MTHDEPAYRRLYESGELQARVERARALLESCRACPRDCKVNRLEDKTAACHTGRYAIVSSYFPHFGEEDCLRGWNGSGTIFFSMCNLRCVFCQNYDISQLGQGREARPQQLAAMMLELQARGCHNINFVTPEHVVPQILEALPLAIERGLRLPLVYNTSAYDSLESLQLMDGVIDIYMPDFKFWDSALSLRYLKAKDYPEVARRAIKEMHRQVGDLVLDEHGLARRGLLVRHLVMPGELAGTRQIMRFIAQEISPATYVNIMGQYYPAGKVSREKYTEINRRITPEEYEAALQAAYEEGIRRLDQRPLRQLYWQSV